MKWIWIAVLIVVGVIAGILAFEYLTNSIGQLPSWVPGHVSVRKTRGHMHKRGYAAAIVAVGAFAGAGWLIYKNQLAAKATRGSIPAA
jgi:hypothetical protein